MDLALNNPQRSICHKTKPNLRIVSCRLYYLDLTYLLLISGFKQKMYHTKLTLFTKQTQVTKG